MHLHIQMVLAHLGFQKSNTSPILSKLAMTEYLKKWDAPFIYD
jgi:hypothetical protein